MLEWSEDIEIVKRGAVPESPIWFTYKKHNSSRYFWETGMIEDAEVSEDQLFYELAIRLADEIHSVHFSGNDVVIRIPQEDILGLIETRQSYVNRHRKNQKLYMTIRILQEDIESFIEEREAAFQHWTKVTNAFTAFSGYNRDERRLQIVRMRDQFSEFLNRYPMESADVIYSESIWIQRGDFELLLGDTWAAYENYQSVFERSPHEIWKSKADSKLSGLSVGPEDKIRHKIRRQLEGEKIAYSAILKNEDSGESNELLKVEDKVAQFLEAFDAILIDGNLSRDGDQLRFKFEVSGSYSMTADTRARGGQRIGFHGTLQHGFLRADEVFFHEESEIAIGQIIFGKPILNDMIALKTYEIWENAFRKYFSSED